MKILFTILTIITALASFAQQPFQGTIVYKLHSNEDAKKPDALVTVQFGKDGLKLKLESGGKAEKDEILIRIDSAKVYTLNTESNTYTVKRLYEKTLVEENAKTKMIAGHSASPDYITDYPLGAAYGSMFRNNSVVVYVADSLFYPVPEKFRSNFELSFVKDNKIVLGVIIKGSDVPMFMGNDDEDDVKPMNGHELEITAEAITITPETISGTTFEIPPTFVRERRNYNVATDSVAVADSVAPANPPKTPSKKQPVKSLSPVKSRPKATGTQPARKPE